MTLTAPPLIAQVLDDLAGRESAPVGPLASRLVTDGAEVVVIGSVESNRQHGFTIDPRIRFVPLDPAQRKPPVGGAWLLRAIRDVRLATAGADLVHAHGRLAGLLASAGIGKRVPLVVSWYRWMAEGQARYGPVPRLVARRADVNCAGSWAGLQRLRAWGASDARLVPPARPSDPGDPTGATGLSEPTGPDTDVLRAALGARRRPLVVLTAGSRRQAHQLVAELSMLLRPLTPRPVVIGPEDAWSATPAADLLITVGETDTLLARRALAAGVPLVIAEQPADSRDPAGTDAELRTVAHDAALYVSGETQAIATAVERLLDDAVLARRLAVAARRQAAGWPDEQDTIAQLVAIYRELLTAR